jgi:hypothetical protein
MADMQRKHHKLIQDAINDSVQRATSRIMQQLEGEHKPTTAVVHRILAMEMTSAFTVRLNYTMNDFSSSEFSRGIK